MFSLKLYLCGPRLRPQKGKGEKKSANEGGEMTKKWKAGDGNLFFLAPFPTHQSTVFVVLVVFVFVFVFYIFFCCCFVLFFFCCFAPLFAFFSATEPGLRLTLHVQADGQNS